MASDRTPLSQRIKSLTSRQRDAAPAATAVEVDAASEQPTGEIAALTASDAPHYAENAAGEQPTTELSIAAEPPTAEHAAVAFEQPTTEHQVVPAPADEAPAVQSTVWPQRTPTPAFVPADAPAAEQPPLPPAAEAVEPAADQPAAPQAPGDAQPSGEATEAAPPATTRRRAGLGGMLRRRGSSEPEEPVATQDPAAEAPAPAAVPAAPVEQPEPARPSFGERAALRRRAKTLRARRDAGLLELGAIVLDQRRFGDPTEGSLVRRRTDELSDLDSELAAIEQILDDDGPAETVAQLGVVRCVDCATLIGPRDRFCVACGAPRPLGDDAPPAQGA